MDKLGIVKELQRLPKVSKRKLINYLISLGFYDAARCKTWEDIENYVISNPSITPEVLLRFKATIAKGEVEVEETIIRRKVKARGEMTAIAMEKVERPYVEKLINDILKAFMELHIDSEEQLDILRKKYAAFHIKIPEGKTIVDILRASPPKILESLYEDFVTGTTGKRLVYEFWNWFKDNDKNVRKSLARFKDERDCRVFEYSIALAGKAHYIDLIVFTGPSKARARYIECKDWKKPVPWSVVKDFLDLVKGIKKAKIKPEPTRAIYVVSRMGYERDVLELLRRIKYPFIVQLYEKTPKGTFRLVLEKKPPLIPLF